MDDVDAAVTFAALPPAALLRVWTALVEGNDYVSATALLMACRAIRDAVRPWADTHAKRHDAVRRALWDVATTAGREPHMCAMLGAPDGQRTRLLEVMAWQPHPPRRPAHAPSSLSGRPAASRAGDLHVRPPPRMCVHTIDYDKEQGIVDTTHCTFTDARAFVAAALHTLSTRAVFRPLNAQLRAADEGPSFRLAAAFRDLCADPAAALCGA